MLKPAVPSVAVCCTCAWPPTKLDGATGEFLVAVELCRFDLIAVPFSGSVRHYDVIASGRDGGHVPVQVKAINGNTWQFKIRSVLEGENEKERQVLGSMEPPRYSNLQVVLVALRNGSASA